MKNTLLALCMAALGGLPPAAAQYTVYPVPHSMTAGTGKVSFSQAVTIVCEDGIDEATRNRAVQVLSDHGLTATVSDKASGTDCNIFIGINGSGGKADTRATESGLSRSVFSIASKYDRHILSLSAAGDGVAEVVILGETTDAAFYALATLEQILDAGTSNLTCATVADYADQKSRGIVEGYYGYPYSVSVKKDLMRFMMRYKMNTYLYGAKSDPYHSNYWQDSYPASITSEQEKNGWLSQSMVKEITDVSHATKVNFIWAIHPGNNFVGSSTAVADIMGKFEKMYNLGVRQFAVFVDDVSIPSTDAEMKTNADRLTALQEAIEAKWNTDGAAPADTVRPLHFVPQIYCTNFASSTDQYNRFFKALSNTPSYVTIYTTGAAVWSVPNNTDLATPKAQLGRNVAWWWNYPCNDNADGQIFPMDMYSNFYDMPSVNSSATAPTSLSNGLGVVSNPMQEGEVAKIPLFSVADMAWNVAGFDNASSWEASFAAVLPGNEPAQKALRYLAPYLRYNDPSDLNTLISDYKKNGNASELKSLMAEIVENCDELAKLKNSADESEALLYNDLSPWLLKLRSMASTTGNLLTLASDESKDDAVWTSYLEYLSDAQALSTAEEYKAYALEGMGTSISVSERPSQPSNLYLLPFVDYMTQNALNGYFDAQESATSTRYVSSVSGTSGSVTGSTTQYVTQSKAVTLAKGEWMGLQMPLPTKVEKITVADTLWQNHSVVMSADGKQWTRITAKETVPEGYLAYLLVVNDSDTPESVKFNAQSLRITNVAATRITQGTIPDGEVWQSHTEDLMRDGDYTTFVCLNQNQKTGDTYTVKLSKKQPVYRVRIAMGTTNDDYMTEGRVQVSADGSKWTSLKVYGTSTTSYRLSLPQVTKYNDDVTLCDFNGEGIEAQYVRLYVSTANTSKWLRLCEIEVNGEGTYTQARCEDGAGVYFPQAYDADPTTSTSNAAKVSGKGELTYYFQKIQLLNGVTLYCDPATMGNASVAYTRDMKEWTDTEADFSTGVAHVSFPGNARDAAALRISWTGSATPAIYEVVENADESAKPNVTSIQQVTGGSSADGNMTLSLKNGCLVASSPSGISEISVYDIQGRLLLSQRPASAKETVVAVPSASARPLIVLATPFEGSAQSYKIR